MPHFNDQGVLVPTIQQSPKLKQSSAAPSKKRTWMPVWIASAIFAFCVIFGIIAITNLWPRLRQSIQRTAQSQDFDKMKSIAAALNAYSNRYGTYPPPTVKDADGMPLYSWRVLVLPFMGYEDLYKKFDLAKPWDSAVNANLFREMPIEFASQNSPDALGNFETNYVLLVGAGTLFPPSGPVSKKGIDQPTLLIVETKNNCIWSCPGDLDLGRSFKVGNKPMVDLGGLYQDSFTAMTVDEEAMRFPLAVPQSVLDALVTPNGGENVQASTFMAPK